MPASTTCLGKPTSVPALGKDIFIRTIFTIGFYLLSFPIVAQDSLKILSWNIQMLPSVAKAGGKAKRARAIAAQLNLRDYDVVVFQELFHKRSRRIITNGLKENYPNHTPVLNKKFLALKTNGGVMLFSKHPIKEVHQIRYKDRQGFDRMARKGALMAELDIHGKSIQVIGTHLQAFSTQEILYSQYHQLSAELLSSHEKDAVPQFICGDFNTLKALPPKLPADISQDFINRLPRYQFMLQTLNAQDGDLSGEQQFTMDRPYNDLCETRKEYRLLLDYILVRPQGLKVYSIRRQVQIMRAPWHKDHRDLSDHFGLEAVATGF